MVYLALVIFLVIIAIIIAAAIRYFWGLSQPTRQPLVLPQRKPTAPSHPLRNRLIELCHGDAELADRLYLHSRRDNKSVDWTYQKAIDDLIRDRSR